MDDLVIKVDDLLTAEEVVSVRQESGWDADLATWQKCLDQNLINVSARNAKGKVVGVGFLSGNVRHAEIVDLVILPEYRKHHTGSSILDELIEQAQNLNIKYLGLTYDKNYPWLKDFYEKHGFVTINFAMWHKSSLNN